MVNFFKRKRKSHIRSYMRGYQYLKKQGKLAYLNQIKCLLADEIIIKKYKETEFTQNELICLKQFIVFRILNSKFNESLLSAISRSNKELKFHLPKKFRVLLEQEGFKVLTISNQFRWIIFCFKWYLIGIFSGLIELMKIFTSNPYPEKDFIYFDNLSKNNLPLKNCPNPTKTIVGWYIDKFKLDADRIYHNVKNIPDLTFKSIKVHFLSSPIPSLNTFYSSFNFLLWFLKNIIVSIFSPNKQILFRERVLAKLFQLSSFNQKSKFFFHQSTSILRPLWTYEAEKSGSEIVFYFYSLNYEELQQVGKPILQNYYWSSTSWPNYWLWNKEQINYLKTKVLNPFKHKIVGPIPFSTSLKKENIRIKDKSIIVFDVQPQRDYFFQLWYPHVDFYNTDFSIKFLKEIDAVAKKLDLKVLIKRKRKDNLNLISKKYVRYVNNLVQGGRWIELNPDLDACTATKLNNIFAVIATPFTSVVHFSIKNKLPTIYFNPSKKVVLSQGNKKKN